MLRPARGPLPTTVRLQDHVDQLRAGRASGHRGVGATAPQTLGLVAFVAVYVGGALLLFTRGSPVALLLPAIVPLSLLWPRVGVLRLCLGLSIGALFVARSPLGHSMVPVLGVVAGAAVALVATQRLDPSPPRLGDKPPRRRERAASQAAMVFAVVTLVGLVAGAAFPAKPRSNQALTARSNERARLSCQLSRLGGDDVVVVPDVLDITQAHAAPTGERVLRVAADALDVWRAQTFESWDGRSWRVSSSPWEQRGLSYTPGTTADVTGSREFARGDDFDTFRFGKDRTQTVTVEAGSASILVGAPRVESVCAPTAVVVYEGAVRPIVPLRHQDVYAVKSFRYDPPTARLRQVADPPWESTETGAYAIPGAPGARPTYESTVELPPVPIRVGVLARALIRGQANTYDRADAVKRWLARNIAVTEQDPYVGPDTDVVDALLFDQRSGTPVRIATAMAVLLRSVGIPARLATGYLPGSRSVLGGSFTVRADDAHAWVEVPLRQFGWQRFDPTGRIARAERADSRIGRLRRVVAQVWPVAVALAFALLGWLVQRAVVRRRRTRARPWATRFFARLVRSGSARGRPRHRHETPAEYSAALATSVLPDERLPEVGELLTRAAYSDRDPSDDEIRWAETVLDEAEHAPDAARPHRLRPHAGSRP